MKNQDIEQLESTKTQFVYSNMRVAFGLPIACFVAWEVAANMTDPLVKVFSKTLAKI